jgi:hypothetical protein
LLSAAEKPWSSADWPSNLECSAKLLRTTKKEGDVVVKDVLSYDAPVAKPF